MKPTEYINIYKLLIKILLWAWGAIMLFYFILVVFNQVDFSVETFLKTLLFSGGGILFLGIVLIFNGKVDTKEFNKVIDASSAIQLLKEKDFFLVQADYGFDWDTKMVGFIDDYQIDIRFEKEKGWITPNFNAFPATYINNCEEGTGGLAFYKSNKAEIKKTLKEYSIQMAPFEMYSIETARLGNGEGDKKLMQLIDRMIAVAKSKNHKPVSQ